MQVLRRTIPSQRSKPATFFASSNMAWLFLPEIIEKQTYLVDILETIQWLITEWVTRRGSHIISADHILSDGMTALYSDLEPC